MMPPEDGAATRVEEFGRDFHVAYDMNAPELNEKYDVVVDDLVQRCPVAHSPDGEGYYVLNRYEDVREASQDWETFTSVYGFVPNRPDGMPFWFPVECDPPFHDNLRKVLNPFLSPKAVGKHADRIREIANELIDGFIADGEVEVIEQFANALPARIFCEVVAGMPVEDMPFLQKSFQAGLVGPVEERGAAMMGAQEHITRYMEKRAEEEPRGDVVDAILGFEAEGYEFLNKAGTLTQLTQGGIGTTGFIFAGSVYHMAKNPSDRKRLTEDFSLLPTAIEEFLRFYASAPQLGRKTTREVEVSGTTIPEDEFVILSFGAASRDPSVCPHPTEVDIERSPNRHMAFGGGPHRCIGSHLARLDLKIGLETFLTRIPDFEVPAGFVPEFQVGVTRDMVTLPMIFEAQQP
jgi:cytochrome P450